VPKIPEQTPEQKKAEQERGFVKNYVLWLKYMAKYIFNLPP
jgi:hypothetical protein